MLELGFVTAIFADDDFETVLDFASNNGFACLEVMCWPKGLAERRYAGVTHIDVDHLDDAQVKEINELLKEKGVYISGLGYYPNPLDPDHEKRDFYFGHIKKVITAAARLGVPVVNTFIGRDPRLNLQENLEQFKAYWPPIIAHAEQQGVKIGIENCPMLFTYDEWPGGKNLAISPAIWEQMFEIIPSAHFGLNYDPSHMIWQQMDYLKPLLEFKHKLFHIHLKDAKLFKDKLDRVGIMATPLEYHSPKLPGLGDVDWKKFLNGVRESGYAGPVVIEFEDKMYETSKEKIVEGMLKTRNFLLPLL
ncbi:MAG: sugar phosphate isomerase/epimerase family protein [Sphingobacteriales bacterium]|jgi:sugar phosphate isomerase/epimerase